MTTSDLFKHPLRDLKARRELRELRAEENKRQQELVAQGWQRIKLFRREHPKIATAIGVVIGFVIFPPLIAGMFEGTANLIEMEQQRASVDSQQMTENQEIQEELSEQTPPPGQEYKCCEVIEGASGEKYPATCIRENGNFFISWETQPMGYEVTWDALIRESDGALLAHVSYINGNITDESADFSPATLDVNGHYILKNIYTNDEVWYFSYQPSRASSVEEIPSTPSESTNIRSIGVGSNRAGNG